MRAPFCSQPLPFDAVFLRGAILWSEEPRDVVRTCERANVRTDAEGAISGYLKDEMKSDGQVLKQHGEGFAPSALACYG